MPEDAVPFDPAWRDAPSEEELLGQLRLDDAWELIERFATLTRESGSEDERTAAAWIADRLARWGVDHTVHQPDLFLSVPRSAHVELAGASGGRLQAATPAMSTPTGPEGVRGRVVHVPSGYATSTVNVFDAGEAGDAPDVRGKIAVTEGFANPGKVQRMQRLGAIGVICINPGEYVHEGICTPIWGAPDRRTEDRQPRLPVVAISRPDGERVLAAAAEGGEVTLVTDLDEGWTTCPLVEATIPGAGDTDEFVLLHGHIDSWYVGIGDNATGDATLLEIARVLHENRGRLRRTVRIAWWPGHSTGRYAGSTWYADRFALELAERCVAHVNCDSPGCRDATSYENVMWMAEADAVARGAIRDATGQEATRARPFRAGDISFNNLGVSTFFMLSSEIPAEELERRGSYPVGGCGMNIEWHTPHDTLDVADREILRKDLGVYLLGVLRVANAPLAPLDYRRTVDEIRAAAAEYDDAADGEVDLAAAFEALDRVAARLERAYAEPVPAGLEEVFNEAQRRVGHRLVSLNFSQAGRFRQDPALQVPPLPELASARELAAADDRHRRNVLRTELTRARNHVTFELREAARDLDAYLGRLGAAPAAPPEAP